MRTERAAPVAEITERVREAWRLALGHGEFGDDDSFFRLGGHSLLGAKVMARLGADYGVRLPLSMLFENRTVALLARAVAAVAEGETA
jgi:hypothetical protein